MKFLPLKFLLFFIIVWPLVLNAQWNDRPTYNFIPEYSQDFTGGSVTWDSTTFYGQWDTVDINIFTASDISNGYLKYVWIPKRILMSKIVYDAPYLIEADMMLWGGSNRGGLVLRVDPTGYVENVQEPATGDPGFNKTGIAIYPSPDGTMMIVQFTGVAEVYPAPTPVTRINVPLPDGIPSSLNARYILKVEDHGPSIYVFMNGNALCRIDLNGLNNGIYSGGTVLAPDDSVLGTFADRYIPEKGKISMAQRDANLRLYQFAMSTSTKKQTITFEAISKKLVSDPSFELVANASSGLPVEFTVVEGPATISDNTLTLLGSPGVVIVAANQSGNEEYAAAPEVLNTFYVEDPAIGSITTSNQDYIDNWVATDGLDRELPTYTDTGGKRNDKFVGVFYYTWHGFHDNKVYDVSKILPNYPADPLSSSNNAWGPENHFHFWGEPEMGYYRSEDPWVIRRDLQMLSNAKVDFIYLDVSNGFTYLETVKKIFEVSLEMRLEGIYTPKIVFLTHFFGSVSAHLINVLYDEIYALHLYEDLWFEWEGKPLIFGRSDDPILRPEVKDFFTIKYSWAWSNTALPDQWQWIDEYPQNFGWSSSSNVADQIPVAVASHPTVSRGTSYSSGSQPAVSSPDYLTAYTGTGLHAGEQWTRALDVDPSVIMVTQWNEWIAQRYIWNQGNGTYAGRPIKNGDSYFVDAFNEEFNRDMAPMKGGHTDNYYYQLISNIRKFKGISAPEPFSGKKTIVIDGSFNEWTDITPLFKDPIGDVQHRNFPGYDPDVTYINTTGRNDIIESRVTFDDNNIYFYSKTASNMTANTDQNWMLLFIDIDKDKSTGWEGYDWMINKSPVSSSETSLQKHEGGTWNAATTINYNVIGNEMEIAIPFELLGIAQGSTPKFHFKWADNPQNLDAITSFFTDGEAAPDRRFNFNFDGSATLGVNDDHTYLEGPKIYPNPVRNKFDMEVPLQLLGSRLQIYNSLGQLMKNKIIQSNIESVDVSDFKSGIYFVHIEGLTKVKKIIKI